MPRTKYQLSVRIEIGEDADLDRTFGGANRIEDAEVLHSSARVGPLLLEDAQVVGSMPGGSPSSASARAIVAVGCCRCDLLKTLNMCGTPGGFRRLRVRAALADALRRSGLDFGVRF